MQAQAAAKMAGDAKWAQRHKNNPANTDKLSQFQTGLDKVNSSLAGLLNAKPGDKRVRHGAHGMGWINCKKLFKM
jgi:hypothetical protein